MKPVATLSDETTALRLGAHISWRFPKQFARCRTTAATVAANEAPPADGNPECRIFFHA